MYKKENNFQIQHILTKLMRFGWESSVLPKVWILSPVTISKTIIPKL
jgi:hypothetical protein